jgi:aerobic carbon-monoxide dehydrogenase medium subunit
MYPRAFEYHRATSLREAASMLASLGDEAKLLAGGQSLIPLMKFRFANPAHLVDLNFIPDTSFIRQQNGTLHFGAMTRHAEIEHSAEAAAVPILLDCAAGIADVQVRSRGTIGGSIAEADPSGDWAAALLTLDTQVRCVSPRGERTVALNEFIKDAYTTVLAHDELVAGIIVKTPPKNSGGAYLAFKRTAPVYPSAAVGVQLTTEGNICKDVAITLSAVALTPIRAREAENVLKGHAIDAKTIEAASQAARAASDPQPDMRGSAEYKRQLVYALTKKALGIAERRSRGENVEGSHIYA